MPILEMRRPVRCGNKNKPCLIGESIHFNEKRIKRLFTLVIAATDAGKTVAQVVINWTIHRPGITVALCGAKRAYQIEETAGAIGWQLSEAELDCIDEALEKRGTAASRRTV